MGFIEMLFDPANDIGGVPPGVDAEISDATDIDRDAEYDVTNLEPASGIVKPAPARFRISVPMALPVVPGHGSIIDARTVILDAAPAATARPTRIGLTDVPSGQQIAYMLLYAAGGTFQLAGDQSAQPGARATFPAGMGLILDHVGLCYVWGDPLAPVTLSLLVVAAQ